MKRCCEVIEEINSLDFSRLDDSDLSASIGELRAELDSRKLPEDIFRIPNSLLSKADLTFY